jgi:hypothetical protein
LARGIVKVGRGTGITSPGQGSLDPIMMLHFAVAWSAILVGLISGTLIGLSFHRDEWLGGYDSWRRRMVRLGHVSFLGTGLLNLAFAVTVPALGGTSDVRMASALFIIGAVTMPAVCFLAAWRKPLRRLFVIPVVSLGGAVGVTLAQVFAAAGRS